jgi:hypothetical protein
MGDDSRDSIKTSVIGGVLTAAVLAIAGAAWGYLPGWKWFTDHLTLIWAHLTSPATVPTWWLYILYAVGAGVLLVIALAGWATLTAKKRPTYTGYKQDRFFGVVWRWQYDNGRLAAPCAFCPSCDMRLVYSSEMYGLHGATTTLHCEVCRKDWVTESGELGDLVDKVGRQIDRKIRSGEWRNYVERSPAA